jgi:hypothetical protein
VHYVGCLDFGLGGHWVGEVGLCLAAWVGVRLGEILSEWGSESLLKSHLLFVNPIVERSFVNPRQDGPISENERLPVVGVLARIGLVPTLSGVRGPDTVPRFVVSVNLFPFDGVVRRWLRAHVRKKITEVIPPITYSDSPRTIPLILRSVRVVTPGHHV